MVMATGVMGGLAAGLCSTSFVHTSQQQHSSRGRVCRPAALASLAGQVQHPERELKRTSSWRLLVKVCAYQDEQQQPQQPQPQPNSQGQLQQVDFRDSQLLRKDVELHSKDVEHKLMERIAALEVAQAASTAAVKQEVIERSAALDQKLAALAASTAAVKQEVIERSSALDQKLAAQAASTAAVKQGVIERSAALDQRLAASTAAVKQEVVQLKWWVICVVVLTVAEGATKLLPLVKLL